MEWIAFAIVVATGVLAVLVFAFAVVDTERRQRART